MIDFSQAVQLAAPNRPFVCNPENYAGLNMLDGGPKPTLQEIQMAWQNRPEPEAQPSAAQALRWLLKRQGLPAEQIKTALKEASQL